MICIFPGAVEAFTEPGSPALVVDARVVLLSRSIIVMTEEACGKILLQVLKKIKEETAGLFEKRT